MHCTYQIKRISLSLGDSNVIRQPFYCPFEWAYCCAESRHRQQHCSLAKWQKCIVPFPSHTRDAIIICRNWQQNIPLNHRWYVYDVCDVRLLVRRPRSYIHSIESIKCCERTKAERKLREIEENGRIGKSVNWQRMDGRTDGRLNE